MNAISQAMNKIVQLVFDVCFVLFNLFLAHYAKLYLERITILSESEGIMNLLYSAGIS